MPSRTPSHTGRVNHSALIPYTPYITSWSEEEDPPFQLVERPERGIAYQDETVHDRDSHGALWLRTPSRPGLGQPQFARVHPFRQQRAMRRLLCNVCAQPADRADDGILWLLTDHRDNWPGWPEHMAVNEPPVCGRCIRVASRLCPALRGRAVAVRVRHAPIVGVHGALYRSGRLAPVAIGQQGIPYDDPAIRWVLAGKLVRELRGCTIVPITEDNDTGRS